MNRKDKEMLATQWAKRRMREGFTPHEAAHLAHIQYGLSMAAELRVERECERWERAFQWPTQGAALSARLAA